MSVPCRVGSAESKLEAVFRVFRTYPYFRILFLISMDFLNKKSYVNGIAHIAFSYLIISSNYIITLQSV